MIHLAVCNPQKIMTNFDPMQKQKLLFMVTQKMDKKTGFGIWPMHISIQVLTIEGLEYKSTFKNCFVNYLSSYVSDSSLNVISVEWSNLAAGPDYLPAARNTQPVSKNDTKTSWALRMHIIIVEVSLPVHRLSCTTTSNYVLGWKTRCRIYNLYEKSR